ncbi:hypothetical protein SOJ16_000017 [Caldicellulosiruptor danielii]|uniref:Peroxiredoxin C-terminal domain-containing protein n=1 Tax=Anaerocellum danielii TaxID=1387557 RepID=A0ABZ0TZG8_9FIRM|nr:hypothetical protein [Caldicellulosiruptor danielii]WPX08861.1 hypothetical protein SOJ16_000017 [Caldicellulosiruptor danielii]
MFIVDDKGIVKLIMYYPQEVGRSIDEILGALKALQTSDANGVAMPENWLSNNLMGDKVIIPPASTEALAKERLEKAKTGETECFDWLFYYKKL